MAGGRARSGVRRKSTREPGYKRPRWAGYLATEGRWDDLQVKLERGTQLRKATPDLPPFDREASFLKREVYAFVLENFRTSIEEANLLRFLPEVIARAKRRPPHKPSVEANPFHWVFYALAAEGRHLERWEISRFGRELLYAKRHSIPPELLIGFLYQTGTPDQIYRKAGGGGHEEWRATFISRLKTDIS